MDHHARTDSALNQPLVEFADVTYRVNGRTLLQSVNFSLLPGQTTLLMGPSGSGKSTLLKLLTRQIQPAAGRLYFAGQCLADLDEQSLESVRKQMGMLFQQGGLFPELTVYENVAFPLREHFSLDETMIHDWVMMRLESVGLRGAKDLMPHTLSGGMMRRVALARTMMLDPCLLLYDEPFTGQDPITVGVLCRLMATFNQSMGLTSFIVSHQLQEVMPLVDQVLMLVDGQCIHCGHPSELTDHPDPRVQQFIQGQADGPNPFHYPVNAMSHDLGLIDVPH